jgi:glycosyltransferase involved in cell wall biosynthesis
VTNSTFETLVNPDKEDQTDAVAKVLLVGLHHPELMRGGAQQVCYELFQGLQKEPGIEPILLASTDAAYPALYKAGACITGFDGRHNEFLYLSAEYDNLWHRTSSTRHVERFADFLETIRPDVVHFHHFFTFGIDFLTLTRRVLPSTRIVFTFHEFLSICDARGHMVRVTDHSLCSQASPVRCHQCFPERSPEHFLMRKMWFMRHLSEVDAFTCPSRFMIDRYVDWGIDPRKIVHVPNGQADCSRGKRLPVPSGNKRRFGFFGQMIDVKGIHIILRAVSILRAEGFIDFTVELNGSNIQHATVAIRKEIEEFLAAEEKLPFAERIVRNNGAYQVDQLESRMARVDWCLVPSVWEEAFGLVVSEAWMFRRPVICSNVGGMAERVLDEVHGLHFQMGDPRALASVMRRACTEPDLWERLSAALPEPPSLKTMVSAYRSVYNIA